MRAGGFTALAPVGTYFVYVIDPGGGHTSGFHGAPTTVAVTDGATITADTTLASTRGTIDGTVTDPGGPLEGVLAMTVDIGTGQPGAGDLTDPNGDYSVPGLAPGNHIVEFLDLTGGHTIEFYDDNPTSVTATVLAVTGGSAITADAELATQTAPGTTAHLTGTVTATTGGDLAGVAVLAVRTADFSFAAGAVTDATGGYDIALDPGDYKLAFYDPAGTHFYQWHDGQPAAGVGAAVTVTGANGAPAVTDAELTSTTGAISGTVTTTAGGDPLPGVIAVAINATGTVVGAATTEADGTYTITGVPPGAVRVRYVSPTNAHLSEYFDDSPDYAGATQLAVTAGATTAAIDAALTPNP